MTKQHALAGALLLGLAIAAPAQAALPDDGMIDDGSRKLQSNDLDGALAAFERAEKLAPRDPRPHYLRAAALQKRGDDAGAERSFRAALKLDPKLSLVRSELGALYTELKRYDEARVELKIAVAEQPDIAAAWFNLGEVESQRGSCQASADAYLKATQLAPTDADGWINRAVELHKCRKLDEAAAAGRQAVKVAPRSAPAYLNLALILKDLGRLEDAGNALNLAVKIKPDYALAWWTLGRLELERKHPEPAIAALDKARQLSPTPARIDDLGRAWRDKGDFARAEALFKEAAAGKGPSYHPAHFHLAQLYAATGRCAEMKRELDGLPAAEARSEGAQRLKSECQAKK